MRSIAWAGLLLLIFSCTKRRGHGEGPAVVAHDVASLPAPSAVVADTSPVEGGGAVALSASTWSRRVSLDRWVASIRAARSDPDALRAKLREVDPGAEVGRPREFERVNVLRGQMDDDAAEEVVVHILYRSSANAGPLSGNTLERHWLGVFDSVPAGQQGVGDYALVGLYRGRFLGVLLVAKASVSSSRRVRCGRKYSTRAPARRSTRRTTSGARTDYGSVKSTPSRCRAFLVSAAGTEWASAPRGRAAGDAVPMADLP